MISKSFLKSSLIFTIGGALPMVASIILLPFYANRLSDLQYTQVSFFISISLLFQILFSYSIESYFGIEFTRLNEDPVKQKRFIGTVSILLLIIGAALLLLSAAIGNTLFPHIFPNLNMDFWPYGFYSILTAFFNSYFKASSICLIYQKRPGFFLTANIINFFVTIIISVGGLMIFPDTIIGPIYGRLLSGVVIFLLGQMIFSGSGTYSFDKSFLKDLWKFCTPYLVYVICGWTLGQIDRYFLVKYIDKVDLNAYDLVLKCFFGIEFLQNSLSAVIFPKLYEIWTKNKENSTTKESNRYFNVFTAINILQIILFCLCIPLMYHWLLDKPGFYRAEMYIGLLASGYALRSILNFYISTILFSKKINVLLKISVVSAVFQIVVVFIASKYYGLMGAIYAGLATKVVQVIFSIVFSKGTFNYQFNYFKIIVVPFILIAVNLVQFLFFPVYNWLFYAGQFALFSLIFFFLFRNEITAVYLQFLGKKSGKV
ncbi:MAG: hypothetical protein K0S32_735 [Bacteroidetes bacterium]|jgi:O-antigen/teichoic acid export membrane protein|nr:hypothetical protein [Bacteroidota bacterium]